MRLPFSITCCLGFIFASNASLALGTCPAATTWLRQEPSVKPTIEEFTGADLIAAARAGEVERVQAILESGIDVNSKTEYGATALFFAADRGNKKLVQLLLDAGAEANLSDTFYKSTPVNWAAQKGFDEVVVMLLKSGADGADNMLLNAFSSENEKLAKLLVEAELVEEETLVKALAIAKKKESAELIALLANKSLPEPAPKYQPTSDELKLLVGKYKSEQATATIKLVENKLSVDFGQGSSMPLDPVKQNEFSVGPGSLIVKLDGDQIGGVTVNFGNDDLFLKRLAEGDTSTGADTGAEAKAAEMKQPKSEPESETFAPSSPESLAADLKVSSKNWPSFRGNGARGIGEGQTPPVSWNVEKSENLLWKTEIPGLGLSCPVIWDDRMFVTTAVSEDDKAGVKIGLYGSVDSVEDDSVYEFRVYCLNKRSGEVLWERTAHKSKPAVKRHAKSSHANPTVATDGKNVVAFFGSEGLYCFDVDGNLKWQQDFGLLDSGWFYDPDYQWGFGSSPVIYQNLVFLQCDIQNGSFVTALDLNTGAEVWRTERAEIPSWSSPTVHEFNGKAMLITHGTKAARGYDALTGEQLWELPGHSEIVVPTPFVAHDMIYVASGYRPIQPIYAIKPSATGSIKPEAGASTNEHVAWSIQRGGPYMPTPIVYGDYLYCCQNSGIVSCIDARTGKQAYRKRLKSKSGGTMSFVASPLAGDGHLFLTAEDGQTYVLKAGPEFEQVAENSIGEYTLATPAISEGVIFFRTQNSIIAVGEQRE